MPHRHRLLLELDLTQPLIEPSADDPLERFFARGRRLLRPTLRALHQAAGDARVGGLIAKVGGPLPWTVVEELRLGVAAFAKSGKPATAWAESFVLGGAGMASYVLASAFDEIWLQPGGELSLPGVAVETTFLRGALDRLGVLPEFEQRHEYKNAPDQLLRTGYTDAHREALTRLTGSVFETAIDAIGDGRGMSPDRVRELVDAGPWTAPEALRDGLVDRLGYRDEVYAAARAAVGDGAVTLFADQWKPRRRIRPPARLRQHVALVEARGAIGSGRSRRTPMGRSLGSDTVAAQLRAALRDEHARAVVLQVDSPGGSAVASEVIWRELVRLREAGRTTVVSMGALAASGGYYIACPAEVIVALPTTLTGSIGVFGGKLVVEQLLERAGITGGSVEHGAHARMWSARRPFTAAERERLAASVDAIYADFVGKVAAGRRRDIGEIEPLARGRVWSGRDALRIGLVDELGGLRDAVRIARERAGLPDRAPVRPALRVPPLARLGKPKNSDDPRAAATTLGAAVGDLASLGRTLGLPQGTELLMPGITIS
ncbi:signal peptide peptidase SppA [Microlunatus ginsengisoli]|uniref:Signal peptide peptidase SppA n=1 Tax=Microlunatus ginsengisoli TaxID=363863 RepID=A0ABP6Z949_9ACTN